MRQYWRRRLFWAATAISFLILHKVLQLHAQRRDRLRHSRGDSLHSASAAVAAAAAALGDETGGGPSEDAAPVVVPEATRIAGPPEVKVGLKKLSAENAALQEQIPDDDEDGPPGSCPKPDKATFETLLVPPPKKLGLGSLEEELPSRSLAWCHDGNSKNGQFKLAQGGKTEGDFEKWGLKRWRVSGKHIAIVDNGENGNVHTLIFNCDHTGFKVKGGDQRGFVEGLGIESAATLDLGDEEPVCEVNNKPQEKWSPSPGKLPVWVMWDFPHGVPPAFRMNMRTWQRRMSQEKFELQLVNQSNIRRYLPGIPDMYFRFYNAAKSDFMRASLLAVHGGVYLDGDILLSADLEHIVRDILEGRADVMPYEGPGDKCPQSYTTNFMAAVRGNALSSQWISVTLRKMRQRCKLDESQNHREPVKVCCFQKSWCLRKECHVAWGDISHPPLLSDLPAESVRLKCVPFKNGFSTTLAGDELFWKLSAGPTDKREHCWPSGNSGLECAAPLGHLPNFFDKQGHHLYNMLKGFALEKKSDEEILSGDMVVSELYRRALGIAK